MFDMLGLQVCYNRYYACGRLMVADGTGMETSEEGRLIYEFAYVGKDDPADHLNSGTGDCPLFHVGAIRTELGVTQQEMTRKLYVTRQAVSRWETDETVPGIDMIMLLCVTFGVPLERFFEMPMEYSCQDPGWNRGLSPVPRRIASSAHLALHLDVGFLGLPELLAIGDLVEAEFFVQVDGRL